MNNLGSYQKSMSNRITGAKPETLMVMLYDGMITKLKQAKERFSSNQNIKAKEAVIRAMRIADALMDNINHEEGGDTAAKLEQLYYFVISELAKSNREKDPLPHLDNSIKVLEILLDGWRQLEHKTN